jgi:hypothetical protein
MRKLSILGLVLVSVLCFDSYAWAAASDVGLSFVSLGQSQAGQAVGITVGFKNAGNSQGSVVVDIELYNSSGNRVTQNFWENENFAPNEGKNYMLNPPVGLGNGQYRYSVGVFNPGWSGILHWYDNVASFIVNVRQGTPVLFSSSLSGNNLGPGENVILSASFTSANGNSNALLDLELYNSAGQKLAQKFWDNVNIPHNVTIAASLASPNNLVPGTYTFKAGIFNPGWNGLINWYDKVQTLTVMSANSQIFIRDVQRARSNVPFGTSTTVTANLTSTGVAVNNATARVYLFNQSGQLSAQSACGANFVSGNVVSCLLQTPTSLPRGTYNIIVSVANSSGNQIASFPNLGTIVVE